MVSICQLMAFPDTEVHFSPCVPAEGADHAKGVALRQLLDTKQIGYI